MTTPRRVRTPAAPAIDIIVESTSWKKERDAKTVVRQAIVAAARAVPERTGELAVVLTDDAAIRTLNRTPALLGDIVIAYETTAREAQAEGKPFRHHLAHLAVHGYLHLAGHDHEADAEAEAMESLEIAVLARLKVPNPYIARNAKG